MKVLSWHSQLPGQRRFAVLFDSSSWWQPSVQDLLDRHSGPSRMMSQKRIELDPKVQYLLVSPASASPLRHDP